ncbi:SDR family NAD(P)-dependent oxidoreductase [Spirillospora sp. CA-253888]
MRLSVGGRKPRSERCACSVHHGRVRGLGKAFAEAALSRGDRIVAAARDVKPLAGLKVRHPDALACVPFDVSDRAAVHEGVQRTVVALGRLDVVVNNRGHREADPCSLRRERPGADLGRPDRGAPRVRVTSFW